MQTVAHQLERCGVLLAFGCLLLCCHAEAKVIDEVSGSYSITRVTAFKQDMRISITVSLINSSDNDLSTSNATLSSPPWRHMLQTNTPVTVLEAHSRAVLTFDVTIPRQEFEAWRKGVRPLLSLEIVKALAHPSRVSIRLTRKGALQEEQPCAFDGDFLA